jgi:hypothetical protein
MAPSTDSDIAAALGIAMLVIIFALGVWPGYARVRAVDIEGAWAPQTGELHLIRSRPQISARAIVISSAGHAVDATLYGLRGIRAGNRDGYIGFDGTIRWEATGASPREVWFRQGMRRRASSATTRG